MRRILILILVLFSLAGSTALAQDDPDFPPLPPSQIPQFDRTSYELLTLERAKLAIYCGDLTQLIEPFHNLELACLSKDELRLLRNTIWAEHGMIFKSEDLTKHFSLFSWYKPVSGNMDALLTEVDKVNIQSIVAFETAPKLKIGDKTLQGVLLGGWHNLLPSLRVTWIGSCSGQMVQ